MGQLYGCHHPWPAQVCSECELCFLSEGLRFLDPVSETSDVLLPKATM